MSSFSRTCTALCGLAPVLESSAYLVRVGLRVRVGVRVRVRVRARAWVRIRVRGRVRGRVKEQRVLAACALKHREYVLGTGDEAGRLVDGAWLGVGLGSGLGLKLGSGLGLGLGLGSGLGLGC